MNSTKQLIQNALKEVLKEMEVEGVGPEVSRPTNPTHGDYSTNVALIAFGKSQKINSPFDLARRIVGILHTKYKIPNTSQVEVAGPGFINFWLSEKFLVTQLSQLLEDSEKVLKSTKTSYSGKKIIVEYTDPNPFKEFHIGHLYSNAVGESICRILEFAGAIVRRVCYQGDVGIHVAKAIYGLLQVQKLGSQPLEEKIKILGQAYAIGARAYEKSKEAKQEIVELNKKIYQQDASIRKLYQKGKQWSLDYFESIYERLGTKFDGYYFESEVGKIGLEYVKEHIKDGVFEEHEAAVIFPGKKHGLHNRVFINSLGLPTYEAKELGLAPAKYKDFLYDLSIIVTGNEIIEYFKVLLKALFLISPDLASKTKHIAHGMVRLPTGKMSSRKGDVLTGEWLLDEAKKRIQTQFPNMDKEPLEMVAVGAVKYALLKGNIGSDVVFHVDESISFEGNSGPYIQYTYARTQSILRKVNSSNYELRITNYEFNQEERFLLRMLVKFGEVIEESSLNFAPNMVCTYLYELAQSFNLFYQKHQVIGSQQEGFRLGLVAATGNVLKNGLYLLGIQAPEKM